MAHIRRSKGRWRVEIERMGVRQSKTFDTQGEAEAWAGSYEPKLVARLKKQQALANSTLLSEMPRRVLDAMAAAEYTQEEVASNAVPLPMMSGVYFLINKGRVVYVGQSVDVFARISRHRREAKEFDSFNYMLCPPEQMDELEQRYILAFLPMLNMSIGRSLIAA